MASQTASETRKVSDAHWVPAFMLTLLRLRASQVCEGIVALSRVRGNFPCEGSVLVVRNDPHEPFIVWDFHYDTNNPQKISFFNGFYTADAQEATDDYRSRPS